jgi:hypothetical protein
MPYENGYVFITMVGLSFEKVNRKIDTNTVER